MALVAVLGFERQGLGELNRQVIETGDLLGEIAHVPGMSLPHECHLFTWEEIERLLEGRPCELIDAATANYFAVNLNDVLAQLSEAEWARFLDWEEMACRSHGVLERASRLMRLLCGPFALQESRNVQQPAVGTSTMLGPPAMVSTGWDWPNGRQSTTTLSPDG